MVGRSLLWKGKLLRLIAKILTEHFALVLVAALLLGLGVQTLAAWLQPGILYLLMAVLYLGFLKVDYTVMREEIRNWRVILALNAYVLILLPVVLYFLTKTAAQVFGLHSEWEIGVLLLFGAPTAALAPTLALIMGGRFERTLVNVICSSFLVPLTLPALLYWLAGSQVSFSLPRMMLFLAQLILIPWFLSGATARKAPRLREALLPHIAALSILLLLFVVIGAVAGLTRVILESPALLGEVMGVSFVLFPGAFVLGWWLPRGQDRSGRMTTAIIFTWTNIGLAIVVANEFFRESLPLVVLFVALCEIPWNVSFVPAQWFAQRVNRNAAAEVAP